MRGALTRLDADFNTPAPTPSRRAALSVGVVIDLEYGPRAGGHVKCWERFAEAAMTIPDILDLTLYFLGQEETEMALSDTVRHVMLPPVLGTKRFPFLRNGGGDTDLASFHGKLAKRLPHHDVLHATDAFTFARTALSVAKKRGLPLVSSLHTDLPKFTEVYAREIIGRMTGGGALSRLLLERAGLDQRLADQAKRRLERFLAASDRVLISREADRDSVSRLIAPDKVTRLRRGVDQTMFNPRHRNQAALREMFLIPPDRPVLLFVGRADDSKNVMVMANAARLLLDRGLPLHVLIVGQGGQMEAVRRLLGPNATLPGSAPQNQLPLIYASSDLFVFPSESEIAPNVVLEAKSSGLPVVISARDGGRQFILAPGRDGVLVPRADMYLWAEALAPLVEDAVLRAELSYHGRRAIERSAPSWYDVLIQDLLPVWTPLAQKTSAAHG